MPSEIWLIAEADVGIVVVLPMCTCEDVSIGDTGGELDGEREDGSTVA